MTNHKEITMFGSIIYGVNHFSRKVIFAAITITAAIPSQLLAQVNREKCGTISTTAIDYRAPKNDYVNQIEGAHFPPIVELLIRGNRGYLGGDLEYTISRIPNHHRALTSIARYGARLKKDQPPNLLFSVECYYERALRFTPDDHVAHLLYAQFLIDKNRFTDAKTLINTAGDLIENSAEESGFTFYNIGLLYNNMKEYDLALRYAHKAVDAGFSKPELRILLEAAGRWKDPLDLNQEPAAEISSDADSTAKQKN